MTDIETVASGLPAIPEYTSGEVALFGNSVLKGLISQVAFEDQLAELTQRAEGSRQFIGFEMTKAILDLSERDENLNIDAIWEGGKATEKLNTRVLIAFGVLKREISDDGEEVLLKWTDEDVQKLYEYSAELKEKDAEEHKKRFDNRKRLNIRLSDAYKAAIALRDGGTKSTDLGFEENPETKVTNPIIANAPKELAGEAVGGKVVFGSKTVATGATATPTLSALVKLATTKHKIAEGGPAAAERTDKGKDRTGDAKLGMTDETFGGIVNNLKKAMGAQEGKFSADMIKQMKSLKTLLDKTLA
jgi:hypothetical protein